MTTTGATVDARTSASRRLRAMLVVAGLLAALLTPVVVARAVAATDPCAVPTSVACENTKPGNPSSQWDVSGSGTAAIQGFATQMSVNLGETESFKVKTVAKSYRLDIYRMGYYGGGRGRGGTPPAPAPPPRAPARPAQNKHGAGGGGEQG